MKEENTSGGVGILVNLKSGNKHLGHSPSGKPMDRTLFVSKGEQVCWYH